MASVSFDDLSFALQDQETVLEGLERQGHSIPNSCRSGVCQSCLLKAVSGKPPETSQQGLKDTLVQEGYFLACQCVPDGDIEAALPSASAVSVDAKVIAKLPLGQDILGLRLKPDEEFSCHPGQYINLVKDGLIRSYSVANLPDEDGYLELHIKRMPDGRMSNWLHDELLEGDEITVRGPAGNCFYSAGDKSDYPLLLAGTGTGLAPLKGIVRDALRNDHSGDITLIHGALNKSGIYHDVELSDLSASHPKFTYLQSCMDDDDPVKADLFAMVNSALKSDDLSKVKVYLCGDAELINKLKVQVFLGGAASSNIYSDPFITAPSDS
jgi:CDP-4-dehydro-6-deoxyglucose reductase, E3